MVYYREYIRPKILEYQAYMDRDVDADELTYAIMHTLII